MLPFWIIAFVISLAILIKASDYFTNYAEKLGIAIGIPQFIVGVTIVSVGTSLPELMTSIIATSEGISEVVAANVVGSNIANVLLIVGVCAVVSRRLSITRDLINIDIPLLAGATALLLVILWDGVVTGVEGIIAIVAYLVYAHYSSKSKEMRGRKEKVSAKTLVGLIVSCILVYAGAKFTIESMINLSQILGIGVSIISVTAVAIGTSLPELAVSLSASKKKNYEMALGNIFGSNIFNGTIVIGLPSLISDLVVSPDILMIGIPFLIISTALYVVSGISRKIHNWEGAFYLLIYLLFILKLLF